MFSCIKIFLLLTVFSAGLFSAEIDSPEKSSFSFYSYATPVLDLTLPAQKVMIWLGERVGFIKRKTEMQKLAIRATAEKRKKEPYTKLHETTTTMHSKIENQESFLSLSSLLKSWEWSWDIFYFEEDAEEESGINPDQQQTEILLTKGNRQKTFNETWDTKADKRVPIEGEKPKVIEQARLYGNKKKKHSKYPQSTSTASIRPIIGAPINEIIDAPVAKKNDPLDAIITEEIYHPTETEVILQKIAFMNKVLDELEAENKRFSVFSQLAIERENATKECIELIEKVEFLLNEIETSIPDSILQNAEHDFDTNKTDFEEKKTEFTGFLQVVLIPYTIPGEKRAINYWEESMEYIYMYNKFLEEKIEIFNDVINKIDHYL